MSKNRVSLSDLIIQSSPKGEEVSNIQVVRVFTSYYSDNRGLHLKKSLLYQKRKSSGFQLLREDVHMIGPKEVLLNITNLDDCEDGFYTVEACNVSKDWETGYVDSYDYKLVRYQE